MITFSTHLTLNMWGLSSDWLGQYHGCWCPGSLRWQNISNNDTVFIEYVGPSFTWGRILSTGVKSMWMNDIKCKYMFMFPLKNLPCKGLNGSLNTCKHLQHPCHNHLTSLGCHQPKVLACDEIWTYTNTNGIHLNMCSYITEKQQISTSGVSATNAIPG